MINYTELEVRRLCCRLRFVSLLMVILMLFGCAIFGDAKPKPVPIGEVRFYIQEGDGYLSEDSYDKAVESYTAAVNLDPKSIDARRKLGEAYANYGETALALDEFAKIIEIDPDYSHAHNYRGFLYNNQEKWEEAAREYESSLKIDPDNLYTLNHLGLMYNMMNRTEDAKNVLQKAVELDPEMDDPESGNTHNYLGLVYQSEGKYEEAIAEFHKVLEHFPIDTAAHNYLGTVYENTEQYRDATKEYNETLKIDPEDSFARSRLDVLQQSGVIFHEIPAVEIVKDDIEHYISTAPDVSEYPNAGAIILLDKLSYEVTNEGTTRYTIHQIVKICNERGIAQFGEIAIPFNAKYQNIGVNVAKTILPDGTEVEAAMDAYHDITPPGLAEYNLYSDTMLKVVSMPALRPGAILEYKVTLEDAQAVTETFWVLGGMSFQWVEPVLNAKCVLRVPKDINVKWKLYRTQIEPIITEDDDSSTYIWISKDNPGLLTEAAMPPLEDLIPFLMFSTTESWEEVYKWYKELSDPQELADKNIKRRVAELVVGKSTKEEKTKAIFEFVALEIRYVAIELGQGAYQPYPAIDVFKYRYGDCKDKVTLLITMLKEVGIDAYPVLISPAPRKRVDVEIPSIGQFSHVIAAVSVEDDGYVWLDPTIATCRYGDLPAGDQGRKAFVIGKNGGEFVNTPIYPSEANKIASVSEITLLEDGTIRGWERTTSQGQGDIYLRAVYRLISPNRYKEFLENMINQRYPGVQIKSFSISDLYDLDKPVDVRVDFSCPSYGSNLEGTLMFPLPSEGFSAYATLVGTSERQYDFYIGYNMAVEKTLTISIPEIYRVTSLPEDISIEYEFGTFARKYKKVGNSVVKYSVSLKIDTPVIQTTDYSDFKKLIEIAAREDRAQIILTKSVIGL